MVVVEEVLVAVVVDVPVVDSVAAEAAVVAAVEAVVVEEAEAAASVVVDGRRAGKGLKGVSTPASSGRVDLPSCGMPHHLWGPSSENGYPFGSRPQKRRGTRGYPRDVSMTRRTQS